MWRCDERKVYAGAEIGGQVVGRKLLHYLMPGRGILLPYWPDP